MLYKLPTTELGPPAIFQSFYVEIVFWVKGTTQ